MSTAVLALFLLNTLGLLDPFEGQYGLCSAVRDGNVPRVRFLLAVYPDLLDANNEGYTKVPLTLLQIGAQRNQLAVMKALIELGADPQTGIGRYGTPLQIAARAGHREAAELLLANGAILDIYSAVALDKRDEVERFLRVANMIGLASWIANSRFEFNWVSTPLLNVATSRGHAEMAKLLIQYGADPAAKVIQIPCFISDINHKGVIIGLTPTGIHTPELDVPIRKP